MIAFSLGLHAYLITSKIRKDTAEQHSISVSPSGDSPHVSDKAIDVTVRPSCQSTLDFKANASTTPPRSSSTTIIPRNAHKEPINGIMDQDNENPEQNCTPQWQQEASITVETAAEQGAIANEEEPTQNQLDHEEQMTDESEGEGQQFMTPDVDSPTQRRFNPGETQQDRKSAIFDEATTLNADSREDTLDLALDDDRAMNGRIPEPLAECAGLKSPVVLEKEEAITNGTSSIIKPIKEYCLETFRDDIYRRSDAREELEVEDMLKVCQKLDFAVVQENLLNFFNSKLANPGGRSEVPGTWDEISDPDQIHKALLGIKATSDDAKIHRAYGQMKLHESVKAKAKICGNYKSNIKLDTVRLFNHSTILDEIASKKAGPRIGREKRKMIDSYHREEAAGRRWLEMKEWFGGDGVVFVFVIAGTFMSGKLALPTLTS